jgi:hypothetical protein
MLPVLCTVERLEDAMTAEAADQTGQIDSIPMQRSGAPQSPATDDSDLDRALAQAQPEGRVALLVASLTPAVARLDLTWIARLAALAERHALSVGELRTAATDLAWLAREAGQRYPGSAEWNSITLGGRLARLTLAYVQGQRIRFDFKFEQLQANCRRWLTEFPDDALILALAAFGALGTRSTQALTLFEQSINSDNADIKSRQVSLHGMSFADHLPDQANLMLELSATMMTLGDRSSNIYFRRCAALRKLGRYEQALEEIDLAIAMLDVGANTVHQDYVRQRELIGINREMSVLAESLTASINAEVMAQVEEKIEAAATDLNDRLVSGQKIISDSLLKIVEILGLFVTLAGFLIGSGAVVLKAQSFGQLALAMALVLVGSLGFFGLLRLITGYRR